MSSAISISCCGVFWVFLVIPWVRITTEFVSKKQNLKLRFIDFPFFYGDHEIGKSFCLSHIVCCNDNYPFLSFYLYNYVFYDPITGNPYKDVKRSFKTALKKSKIQDFHFHDTRHTFASHLVMAGVDITTVSRLLGHKSLTMTLRYSHLAPAHMQKAVNVLDNALNEKTISTKLAQFNG